MSEDFEQELAVLLELKKQTHITQGKVRISIYANFLHSDMR